MTGQQMPRLVQTSQHLQSSILLFGAEENEKKKQTFNLLSFQDSPEVPLSKFEDQVIIKTSKIF